MNICFIGDIHGKNSSPLDRLVDYNEDLYSKLSWIIEYCNINDINTIVHLGDIHDKWDTSDGWKNKIVKILRDYKGKFYTLIGNHDLPYNSDAYHNQTCLHNLELSGVLKILRSELVLSNVVLAPLSLNIKEAKKQFYYYNENQKIGFQYILCGHHFYEFGLSPDSGFTEEDLKSYNQSVDMILGHDHRQYDQLQVGAVRLLRPGSLMRTELSEVMIDHKPRILIYNSTSDSWSPVEVPHRDINEIYNVANYRNKKSEAKLFRQIKNNLESVSKLLHNDDTIIPCSQALKDLKCPAEEFNYLKQVYQLCGQEF